ncbi:MAG: hypothetical protein H0V44_05240 [Planctomycetes bacterium]|nr:hypothetical protein [Planctomycetota bacterium]
MVPPVLIIFAALLLLVPLTVSGATTAIAPAVVAPSANQGKAGTYLVEMTRHAGINYYVRVPPTYSAAEPAGIHLHFHGQSSQGTAPYFDHWTKHFLSPYNLIGINMQYMDGDNGKDTQGKLTAAREAIAQVMADYKVIPGRGVICSFSGGGLVHALFTAQHAQERGADWPFCQVALYSSNYRLDATTGVPMGWYIGVGGKEWSLANLGQDAKGRTTELLLATAKGGNPDLYFNVIKEKDHIILDVDVQEAATIFPRVDLAYAPFLYAPDFPDKELRHVVDAANALQIGIAKNALAKVLAKAGIPEALKKKAQDIEARIDARIARLIALTTELAANDPVLASFYGQLYLAQCKGIPAEKELRTILAAAAKQKGFSAALTAHAQFAKAFSELFPGDYRVAQAKEKDLEALATYFPPGSQIGRMIANFLSLR